jgi:SAM-dependent methyltransferase
MSEPEGPGGGTREPAPRPAPASTGEWPIAFFDDDYLRIYRPQFTEAGTAAEVDFIESALAAPSGAAVLDLACGFGRHAIGMARRGYAVTGVDFNARYLEIAAEEAARAGITVRWMTGDMRTLAMAESFEAVYSFFTSFGYFSDAENERVLANVARALRPGGRFLIDMANRERVLTHPQQRTWHQRDDGALYMEEATLDLVTSRITSRQILIPADGSAQVVKVFDLRVYTCAELTALLARHGLVARGVWGGSDRSPYSSESRRLVVLAERAAGAAP